MNTYDKQNTSKIMGYTLFIIVTICSTFYPNTNSKYYTNSNYTRSNLEYNAGLYKLYEEPTKKMTVIRFQEKAEVIFSFDRHNVGTDTKYDKFTIVPIDGCTVTSVDGKAQNNITFTSNGSQSPYTTSVSMSCEGSIVGDGTEQVTEFGVDVILKGMAETTVGATIYEEVTPIGQTKSEGMFIYQEFEPQTIKTSTTVPYDSYIKLKLNQSDEKFYKAFVEWIVRYVYTNKNEYKDVIIDYLSQYLTYDGTDTEKLSQSIKKIKEGNIPGITKKPYDSENVIYEVSPNLLGYAQTDNDYNNSSDNKIISMYFTETNPNTVNKIFEEYLDKYFPNEYINDLEKVKDFVRNNKKGNYEGAYIVYLGNYIPGLYPEEPKRKIQLHVEEIVRNATAVNTFTVSTIHNSYANFVEGFNSSPIIKNAGLANDSYLMEVLGSIGASKELYYYLFNGNPDASLGGVNFTDDTYFISYLSGSGASTKYLLTKLSPNRTDDTIEVTLSDLETTLDEPNIKETLKGKDIFINIKTSSASGTSGDAVKTSNLITLLRTKIDADAFPYEGEVNDHISQAPTLKAYYYHFSYKITDTIQEALSAAQPDEVVTTKPKDTDEVAEISEIEAEATPIGGNPPENINDELPLVVLNKAEVLEDFRKAAVETNNEDILDYKVIPAVKLATPESDDDTAETDLEIEDIQRTKLETRPKDDDETEKITTKDSPNDNQGDNREITDIIVDDNTEETTNNE